MTKIKPHLHALTELTPTGECPLGYVMPNLFSTLHDVNLLGYDRTNHGSIHGRFLDLWEDLLEMP
jgi:hypothetical protein